MPRGHSIEDMAVDHAALIVDCCRPHRVRTGASWSVMTWWG